MDWVSYFAIFFVVWWLVLFATLPFSLKTQDEEGEVTLGTPASAPRGPHVARAFLRTTLVTVLIVGLYVIANQVYGLGIDDLPKLKPDFY